MMHYRLEKIGRPYTVIRTNCISTLANEAFGMFPIGFVCKVHGINFQVCDKHGNVDIWRMYFDDEIAHTDLLRAFELEVLRDMGQNFDEEI